MSACVRRCVAIVAIIAGCAALSGCWATDEDDLTCSHVNEISGECDAWST